MNKFIFTCLLILAAFSLQAQNEKLRVAVFDPTSSGTSIDEGTRVAVREIISSTFVNTGKYTIVERSLIERVMQEQKFSNSGAVDDNQASEIGKLIGANKIVLTVITFTGGRNMLSIKMVDVQTANVERQKTQIISARELLDAVEPLTLELMGEASTDIRQTQITVVANTPRPANSAVSRTPRQTPGNIESKKSRIVWGVRAGVSLLNGYEYVGSNNYQGKFGLEIGPEIYYSFNKKLFLNTGLMLGVKRIECYTNYSYNFWNYDFFSLNIPFFMGYHYPVNNKVALFAQTGPFIELNYNYYHEIRVNAGLGIMTGVNIQRFRINIGYQIGSESLFRRKGTLGVSYMF